MKKTSDIVLYTALCLILLTGLSPAGLNGQSLHVTAQTADSVAKSDSCMIEASLAYNNQQTETVKELCLKAIDFYPENDAAYYMLAKMYLLERKNQEAEAALRKASQIDSSNYYYLATLGALLVENKDVIAAVKLYESLIRRFPAKTESYMALMELYVPRGQEDKALELADRLEKAIGPNEQSTMTRFRIYSTKREYQKALDELINADQVTPNEMYETYIADLYAGLGKDSSALVYYSSALEKAPDYVPALYGKMEVFRRYKNYPLYLVYLKSFMANRQTNPSIKKRQLEELMKDPVLYRDYRKEVADCMMEYAMSEPSDSSVAISSAVMLARYGQAEQAGRVLDNILKYYPEDFYIRSNMISFLYSIQNWERLEGFVDTTMNLYPDKAIEIFQFKGIAQDRLKKYDEAIQTFLSQEKTAKKLKDSVLLANIYSTVGDQYHEKNDNKTAFKYYDKALRFNPEEHTILNNYAWYIATSRKNALPDKKDIKKALAMAKLAVEKTSGEFHNLDTYGWVLYLDGNLEEARKVMQQAVAYGGSEDSGILCRYSDILTVMGEFDLAYIYYRKALQKAVEMGNQQEVDKITGRIENLDQMVRKANELIDNQEKEKE